MLKKLLFFTQKIDSRKLGTKMCNILIWCMHISQNLDFFFWCCCYFFSDKLFNFFFLPFFPFSRLFCLRYLWRCIFVLAAVNIGVNDTLISYCWFSLSRNEKMNLNQKHWIKTIENWWYYRRLIAYQLCQVSGLCEFSHSS